MLSVGALGKDADTCHAVETKKVPGEACGHTNTLMENLLQAHIVLKYPAAAYPKSRSLLPLMLIAREFLPLSCLDLLHPQGEFAGVTSRHFESQIRILDLEGRLGCSVLLATSPQTKHVYAIERLESGRYVLCKLGSWVDIPRLAFQAAVTCTERIPAKGSPSVQAVPSTAAPLSKADSKKRLAIEELQSMVRKRPRTIETTPFESENGSSQVASQLLDCADAPREAHSRPVDSTPVREHSLHQGLIEDSAESILHNVRSQYVEMLYHSKGSLAYFAKGPLSRARAIFHINVDQDLNVEDLIEHYKKLLLTTQQIDNKYREGIPSIVDSLKSGQQHSEDEIRRKKRRKTPALKAGKDGLFPDEKDSIAKWWQLSQLHAASVDMTQNTASDIRQKTTPLRTRESQLQLILLLEILALESSQPGGGNNESQLPGAHPEASDVPPETMIVKKKRNKFDLAMMVDVHADRLCIWQSTLVIDGSSDASTKREGTASQEPHSNGSAQSSILNGFCVDVLMPFYAARLPAFCKSLNRKFGGPAVISPRRVKIKATTKPGPESRSGALKKKLAPSQPPRTLDRVLSNEASQRRASQRPMDALARMRSATPAAIPGLKQEDSDTSSLGGASRHVRSQSLKDSGRTLSRSQSICSLDDLKAKRKSGVEAELQEAINALKKPNRQLVGRIVVDENEKRTAALAGIAKKSRKGVKSVPNRIQVLATPANNRFKDVPHFDSQPLAAIQLLSAVVDHPPSSSLVPSTAPRPTITAPPSSAIKGTPLKRLSWTRPSDADEIPASSPVQVMRQCKIQTLTQNPVLTSKLHGSRPKTAGPLQDMTGTYNDALPVRRGRISSSTPPPLTSGTIEPLEGRSSPPASPWKERLDYPGAKVGECVEVPGLKPQQDIYQRLGWDDDDDLDELI